MADFTDIVLFLSSGRSLAWVGSGPSAEMGLPSWRQLAAAVLEECRKRQKPNFRRIERHYQLKEYQDLFDEVSLSYGTEFLHETCSSILEDPGKKGDLYTVITELDFISYFTTNYDNALQRHLEDSGKAIKVYLNSQEDIEAVDVDYTPALVKLHGDFSHPQSVVLTRSDYQRFYKSGLHEGFQSFLWSHLARDRIIFVGYSLTDPEILALQERIATNFRRKVAPIALMSNATQDDVDSWKRRYNIDLVPYISTNSDHSALVSLLKSAADVLAIGRLAPTRMAEDDLRKAQALYMWHRFRPSAAGEAPINALGSLILSSLAAQGKALTPNELSNSIQFTLGVDIEGHSPEMSGAIDLLVESGWVIREAGTLRVLPEGQRIVQQYDRRFEDLMEVFQKQLAIDLKRSIDLGEEEAREFARVVLEALIDLFEVRGRDIMRMVWDSEPVSPRTITDLLRILWSRANTLPASNSRSSFVGFVLNMLINPSEQYESVIDYLAKSFFCIQAIRVDPNVSHHLNQVITDRCILLDENVLIPLTAKAEDRHEFMYQVLSEARDAGIQFFTTWRFVETVREHANWALNLVNTHGAQSEEVYRAALGKGGYTPNAFLNGFINQDPDDRNRELIQYLRDCFGGSYTFGSFESFFEEHLNIKILDEDWVNRFVDAHSERNIEAMQWLYQINQSRPEEGRKSERRLRSEAEAFLLVSEWENLDLSTWNITSSECSFLSSGSSVPALIRAMVSSSKPLMVSDVEMLWELLTRLESRGDRPPSFRSMMMASHFRLAEHFVEPENCRRFFRPLINSAKKEFEESRGLLEHALSTQLGEEFIEEISEVEWPSVVSGLHSGYIDRSSRLNREQERLEEENERLRLIVEKFQQQERKRREFVTHQREQQRNRLRNRRS